MDQSKVTGTARMSRAVYDPPIREAIARGDVAEMQAVLAEAKAVRAQQGDLDAAIAQLEKALRALG